MARFWIAACCLAVGTTTALQQPLQNDLVSFDDSTGFTTYQSTTSSHHSLRIKQQNDTLCDARSPQYTGWLDVGSKHLFFWYFESQSDPKDDPLTLWLTGGPGGSSMLGMLQELGPCLVNKHGNGTVYNPYGWSANSNLLFVDQPAGTGFSYVDEGQPVPGNSFVAAADLHLFLQIFVGQAFPHLSDSAFHISGESYGGHYIPAAGAEIVAQNALHPHQQQINLKSVLIGNGYVSPMDSAFGTWETLCTTHPGVAKPIFNQTRCDILAANMPRCLEVAQVCYKHPDPAICTAASIVCSEGVTDWYDNESVVGGRNRFDITIPCKGLADMCYEASLHLQEYLNIPWVWEALDVPSAVKNFSAGSDSVEQAFIEGVDIAISMQPQVQYLLINEIDVLMYQGNYDLACNTAGNLRWANNMPWIGQTEFVAKSLMPWKSKALGGKEMEVGTFKQVAKDMNPGVSKKKTKFSFVTIDKAGHLVPQDQPEIALDMLTRWLHGGSFEEPNVVHEDL